jgi:hypothetical protein
MKKRETEENDKKKGMKRRMKNKKESEEKRNKERIIRTNPKNKTHRVKKTKAPALT